MALENTPAGALRPAVPARSRRELPAAIRILMYTLRRLLSIAAAIVVAVYLTIWIANLGGHMDQIRINQIKENYSIAIGQAEEYRDLTVAQKRELTEQLVAIEIERLQLDKPFFRRSFQYLWNGLTLNLGRAEFISSDSGSRQVRLILLERFAPTLLLSATSYILIFVVSILTGLALSRNYGSLFDRIVVAFAPASSAPGWFYGIFLILIFSALLRWLPFGGMIDAPPPPTKWAYFVSLMRHLALPVTATFISSIFASVFGNRTFFLIYSSEDYVDMAKAKGLSDGAIERRYILQPTLPTIVTQFALSIILLWQGSAVLERVFNWPGLGQLLLLAANGPDTPVIVASTIIYAYLLAITVLILDFVYALVDPRVQVGAEAHTT